MSRAKGRREMAVSKDNSPQLQGADATPVNLRPDLPDEVGFYKLQDGTKGRDLQSGVYLDYKQDFEAERVRAALEGREQPVLGEVVPATAGTVLVPAGYLFDNSVSSNPSMAQAPGVTEVLVNDDTFNNDDRLVSPVGTYNVDRTGVNGEDVAPYDPSTGGAVSVAAEGNDETKDVATGDSASTSSSTSTTATPTKSTSTTTTKATS